MMRWPRWAHEMAKDGDLLMGAITNTPPCPERRIYQIIRHRNLLLRQWEALGDEMFLLTEQIKAAKEPAQ